MAKQIRCPHCATTFDLTEDLRGRRFACPVCGVPFSVSQDGEVVREQKVVAESGITVKIPRKTTSPRKLAEESRNSSGGCFIFILILLLLAGGGAYWWFHLRPTEPAETTEEEVLPEMPKVSFDDALRRAAEKTAPKSETAVPGIAGSRETVKSRFAWTPQRPETDFPLSILDVKTSSAAQERRAVLESTNGVRFASGDCAEPVRRNVALVRSYPKDDFRGADIAIRLANVRTHIFAAVGLDALRNMAAREGGPDFLEAFFNDLAWMEEFAASGEPFGINERRALHRLNMLVWNDTSNWILATDVGRRLATALALNGTDLKRTELVARFRMYERLYRTGRLDAAAADYTVPVWREVLCNRLKTDDMNWLNNRAHVSCGQILSLTNNVQETKFNCFGIPQSDAQCLDLWAGYWPQARAIEYVGGTESTRLGYAVQIAQAQGLAACLTATGEVLARSTQGVWSVAAKMKEATPGWAGKGIFGDTAGQILAGGVVLADEKKWLQSEEIRWLAATRARQSRAEGWSEKVNATFLAALAIYPLNIRVWREYKEGLEKNKVGGRAWRAFGLRAAKDLAPVPPFAYEMLEGWFAYLKASGRSRAERLDALKEVHMLLREPDIPWSNVCGFDAFLKNSADLLDDKPDMLLELFDTITIAQLGTPHFFDQAVAWAGGFFMKDPRASRKFLAAAENWADPASYMRYTARHRTRMHAAGWQPKVPKLNWDAILYAASEAGNVDGFHAADALARRYAKKDKTAAEREDNARNRDKKADKVPFSLFGARIASEGALPVATPLARNVRKNNPLTWHSFSDASPAGETQVYANADEAPSIMLVLPHPVEIRGVLVKNVDEKTRTKARQSPLLVEVSLDGRNWQLVWHENKTNETSTTARKIAVHRSPHEKAVAVPRKPKPADPPASGFGTVIEKSAAEAAIEPGFPSEPHEWRIDLSGRKRQPAVRYVRVRRDETAGAEPFALAKIVVYGQKSRTSGH